MSDAYLYVKNWDELQHYKTRRPPWIKLYRRLLTDWDFLELSETTQWQLVRIWIISADELPGGWIKDDPKLVRSLLKLSKGAKLRLPELVAKGWLIPRSKAEYESALASTALAKMLAPASTLVQRTEIYKPSFLPTSVVDAEGQEGIQNGEYELPDWNTILRDIQEIT